jgi:hypothetical protein
MIISGTQRVARTSVSATLRTVHRKAAATHARSTVTKSGPTATQREGREDSYRNGESALNCVLETARKSSVTDTATAKVSQQPTVVTWISVREVGARLQREVKMQL